MRVTRSATHKKLRVLSPVDSVGENYDGEDPCQQRSTSLLNAIEDHLRTAQSELGQFKHRMEALEKEKQVLKTDLEKANIMISGQSQKGRTNRKKSEDDIMDNAALQMRIEELELENRRQKKHITKLKRKELQEEVEELQPNNDRKSKDDCDKVDTEDRMRKLLRNFSELMWKTTISDDMSQTCPICFETLELNKSSAMQCQHLVCDSCLPMIPRAADKTVKCPECREPTALDEVEKIYMTEQHRWDQLLDIANTWAAWDKEQISEEETEENFIDDGISSEPQSERSEDANETKSAQPTSSDVQSPCGDGDHDPPTPPSPNNQLFSESPTKEKRKRMEQLAEQRAKKRKR